MIIFENIKQTQSNKKTFFFDSTNNICKTQLKQQHQQRDKREKSEQKRWKERIKRCSSAFFHLLKNHRHTKYVQI